MRRGRLKLWRAFAYAAPALPLAIVMFPSYTILPGFYAEHTNTTLGFIGAVLIAARLFDALIDPVIGHFCDLTPARWGGRKAWLLVGALILSLAGLVLYMPPDSADGLYYVAAMFAFYLGYSLVEISHKALGTDLARDYRDRSRIATALGFVFCVGNLAFALAPFLGGQEGFGRDALRVAAYMLAILAPVSAALAIFVTPRRQGGRAERGSGLFIGSALKNAPLLRFLLIYALIGLGQGVFYGLIYLYVVSVLGLGEIFVWVLLIDAGVSLVAAPVWHHAMLAFQKHRALGMGVAISAAAIGALAFVPNGEQGAFYLMAAVALRAFGAGVIYVAPNALLGDIVDYEMLRSGVNRAANCHALVSLLTKGSAALGGGGALVLAGLAGFDPRAANSETTLHLFRLLALGAPVILLLASVGLAVNFPLGRRAQDIVRRRLEGRSHGAR